MLKLRMVGNSHNMFLYMPVTPISYRLLVLAPEYQLKRRATGTKGKADSDGQHLMLRSLDLTYMIQILEPV